MFFNINLYKISIILCLSILPFLFSLQGDFVFDDSEAIVKNKDVTSDSWVDPFYNDFWGTDIQSNLSHKSYRPLTILSYRFNYLIQGSKLSPVHFKLTNLLCHSLCCLLLWLILSCLSQGSYRMYSEWWQDTGYLATLIFAVHPVHSEAVCGIVGRADLLAAITFFLAFYFYYKATTRINFDIFNIICAVVFATTSMLFKENGITVLGYCIVYEIVIFPSRKLHTNKIKMCVKRIVITAVALFILLYARWSVMGKTTPEFKDTDNPAAFTKNIYTKIQTFNYIYFLNFVLLIWPQWLCYDWSMGCVPLLKSISDHRMLLVLALNLYGILILLTLTNKKKRNMNKRLIVLAASLIVIPFLPASNIFFPVGFVIAERVLYVPSAGYCLLIVIGLKRILNRKFKIGVFMLSIIIMVFTLKSWERSFAWRNEYTLFLSGLSVCPMNAKIHYNIAKVVDAKQKTSWAAEEYREAIRLYPGYYQAMNNLANILKNYRKFSEAEYYLRKAINLKEDFPAAWMNLGIVLASTNRYNESEDAYRTALRYRRKYPDCFYNLGNLYLELNETERAVDNWIQAINLNAKHVLAWTNLLALLDNTGNIDRALELVPKALSELPDSGSVNFAVANIYGKIDRFKEAEKHFRNALKMFDGQPNALHYANFGVLYHRWKKYDLAEKMYVNALKIDPNFKSAQKNLDILRKLKRKATS